MSETTPQPGDRRPREGRCERCDRPLSDLEWNASPPMFVSVTSDPTKCPSQEFYGEPMCCTAPTDWRARAIKAEAALAEARADARRERESGLLAAAMWVLGELDRYERAHGDTPVMEWSDFDRGYRLAVQNVLAALAIIDPARRVDAHQRPRVVGREPVGVGRVVPEDAVNGYTALGLVYLIVAMYAPDAASTFVFGMSTAYFGIGLAESLVAIARRLRRTP